ncbi:DUF5658 family protein [Cohnella endophytica]|uniref:DUF5658 family protein n=1 Tax=Cohnella endophytica TaxID=2419778 RepID=UPI000EAECABC|nr:DUF5658 family protein [Cohnella endophytica]
MILSFFDAMATDAGIRMHAVREANPFAKLLYETNVFVFYSYKIILPLILLSLLRYVSKQSFIHIWIILGTITYGAVAIYHIGWMSYVMAQVRP